MKVQCRHSNTLINELGAIPNIRFKLGEARLFENLTQNVTLGEGGPGGSNRVTQDKCLVLIS